MGRRSKQTFLQRRHTDGWQENEDHKLLKEMQIQSRNDAEAEAPILWPPDVKSWFTRKDPDARKDWAQEKGLTEDETVELHHWLNGHEFEQTLGYSEDREAWCAAVHEVTKYWTQLTDWTTTNQNYNEVSPQAGQNSGPQKGYK